MTLLCDLATKYGTDKHTPAQYTAVYDRLFCQRRDSVRKVLEIGICAQRDIPNHRPGASLFMWREYFPNAFIIGMDIDAGSIVTDDRICSFQGDQSNTNDLATLLAKFGGDYDLIVDDGSHNPQHQVASAKALLPFLVPDGIYAIEDIGHYWFPDGTAAALVDTIRPRQWTSYGERPYELLIMGRM